MVYLLRDLLTHINNPDLSLEPFDYLPTIPDRYDLNAIKLNPLIKKILTKLNNLWKSHEIVLQENDFIPIHELVKEEGFKIVFWELDEVITKKFIRRCKEYEISVNSALYCAIMLVQKRILGEEEKFRRTIMMPINIRNYLNPPVGEEVGLFAGGETFKVKVKDIDFWKQTQKFDKRLKKRISPQGMFAQAKKMKEMDPSLIEARTMIFLGSLLPEPTEKYKQLLRIMESDRFLKKMVDRNASGNLVIGTVLTNIGALKINSQYGNFRLKDVFFIPPSSPFAEKLIGVCTFGGKLRGTISFVEKNISKATVEAFGNAITQFIKNNI